MAIAKKCDCCGQLIEKFGVTINGYTIKFNGKDFPGFSLGHIEDVCSFTCLAEWAAEQQELLNDFEALAKEKLNESMTAYKETINES